MIHVRRLSWPTHWPSRHDQNFNVAIFSASITVIKVKLCMMPIAHALLIYLKIYILILLSVTMTIYLRVMAVSKQLSFVVAFLPSNVY